MHTWLAALRQLSSVSRKNPAKFVTAAMAFFLLQASTAFAQPSEAAGGEANLQLPDLSSVSFLGMDGHKLLTIGLIFCAFGLLFGLAICLQLKKMPVHRTMGDISDLIYETCKTYLITQGKFLMVLWAFIAVVILAYFGWLAPVPGKPVAVTLPVILLFQRHRYRRRKLRCGTWFGIRVNTYANSRTAFAGLRGKPYPIYAIPLKAGMSRSASSADLRRSCSSCSAFCCSFRLASYTPASASSASPSASPLGAAAHCIAGKSSPRSPTSAPT